jgi:hypothetical protein
MISTDPDAVEAYREAIAERGQRVIVRRVTGQAPNVGIFDADVGAIVMDYIAKPPVSTESPEGAVTLGARNIIVLEADLKAKHFPLPLAKNDKVIVDGEELNVMSADPNKKRIAGAIDIVAEGV